jgi:hypothetical protein
MKGLVYRLTRDLHLYFGLFISPFVLVFSVSVFFFVHAWTPAIAPETTRVVSSLDLQPDLATLSGRPLVDALKPILGRLNVRGEIGFVQKRAQEETLLIPISIPGRAISVRLHLGRREATIVTHETGLADALMTLHKSPGGHGPDIRMNWFAMKAWRWFADATVYLTLFITISGLYLWVMLRAERRVGLVLLFAGTVTFFGIAYAVSH